MKKILVTGSSGLIGKSIVKNLLSRDSSYYVHALDLIEDDYYSHLNKNSFDFTLGDCKDFNLVEKLISESDAIIHLAAPSSFLMYKEHPRESTINTIQSFLNILEAMKKNGVKKIIHASTSAVYEGNTFPYLESMKINPPDLKSLSKKFNEELGNQYSANHGIISIAMRPFSVYGEEEIRKGGYANIISLFAWAIIGDQIPVVWGDGKQTRDFIHADDVAEVFCLALEKNIPTQPLNVGTGIETSFNDILTIINKKLNKNLKPKYVPVPIDIYAYRLLSDNKIVEKKLNFFPKISLDKGIDRIIKTYLKEVKKNNILSKKQLYFEAISEVLD